MKPQGDGTRHPYGDGRPRRDRTSAGRARAVGPRRSADAATFQLSQQLLERGDSRWPGTQHFSSANDKENRRGAGPTGSTSSRETPGFWGRRHSAATAATDPASHPNAVERPRGQRSQHTRETVIPEPAELLVTPPRDVRASNPHVVHRVPPCTQHHVDPMSVTRKEARTRAAASPRRTRGHVQTQKATGLGPRATSRMGQSAGTAWGGGTAPPQECARNQLTVHLTSHSTQRPHPLTQVRSRTQK